MTASKAVGTSARSELAGELRRVSSKLPQSASSSASSQAQANSKSNTSSEGIIDPAITAAAASLLQWVRAHPSLLADHAADVELAFRAEMQSKENLSAQVAFLHLSMGFALAAAREASSSNSSSTSSSTNASAGSDASSASTSTTPMGGGGMGLIAKMPFLLILDTLERCTVAEAEHFWSTVEAAAQELTRPELFSKGKLTVLRFCNALLRRLSKSSNTEFCGRVLMFLAHICALSERSAVNVGGKANTSNTTSFDTSEQDSAFPSDDSTQSSAGNGNAAALFHLGEDVSASSNMSLNPMLEQYFHMAQHLLGVESGKTTVSPQDQEEGEEVAMTSSSAAAALGGASVDFNLYKTFWGLQTYVAGDSANAVLQTTGASSNTNAAAAVSNVWSGFVRGAEAVLAAFESSSLMTEAELRQQEPKGSSAEENHEKGAFLQSRLRAGSSDQSSSLSGASSMDTSPDDNNSSSSLEYQGCKYLTSPQLFSLELRDPAVRCQLLLQMLIHMQFVSLKLEATPSGSANSTIAGDIAKLEPRCHSLLKRTPPIGAQLSKRLSALLLPREGRWFGWKKSGCPPFEKAADSHKSSTSNTSTTNGTSTSVKKRKASVPVSSSATSSASTTFFIDTSGDRFQQTLADLADNIPSFDRHIQSYVEAEDPSAGIDDEYHPKHDAIYCWRARRLLASRRLSAFEDMQDGDLGKALKRINKDTSRDASGTTTTTTTTSTTSSTSAGAAKAGAADDMEVSVSAEQAPAASGDTADN